MKRPRLEMPIDLPGVTETIHLGRYNQTAASGGLGEHSHGNAMEFCLLLRGRQTYLVGDEPYTLAGGDVFVTFPGETHGTGPLPQEKGVLYWLILELPSARQRLLNLPEAESAALVNALRSLPRRHFPGSSALRQHLDEVTRLWLGGPSSLKSLKLAHHLVGFLIALVETARSGLPFGNRAASLAPIRSYIAGHLEDPLPIALLAEHAGLSLSRFKARFREEHGMPPGEFVVRSRVSEAVRRLRETDQPITRIAFDLGFSSSQYFATVIKRYTLKSPSDVRRTAGRIAGQASA